MHDDHRSPLIQLELQGGPAYALHFYLTDTLSPSQRAWAATRLHQFKRWYADWTKQAGAWPHRD